MAFFYISFIVVIGFIYTLTVYQIGVYIYAYYRLLGSLFFIFYVTFGLISLLTIFEVATKHPIIYKNLLNDLNKNPNKLVELRASLQAKSLLQISSTKRGLIWILAVLIPRGRNLVNYLPAYMLGLITACSLYGLSDSQAFKLIKILNFLVSPDITTNTISAFWIIGSLSVFYFFLCEVLMQQSKHIWNDIRDIEFDKKIPGNKDRAIATGLISIESAKLNLILRAITATFLALILNLNDLLVMFLWIWIHQIIYVLELKPSGQERPLLTHAFLTTAAIQRFALGILTILGSDLTHHINLQLIIVFLFMHFMSFGPMAAWFRLEAEYINKKNIAETRKQHNFYLNEGLKWQRTGIIASILTAMIGLLGDISLFTFYFHSKPIQFIILAAIYTCVFVYILQQSVILSFYFNHFIESTKKNEATLKLLGSCITILGVFFLCISTIFRFDFMQLCSIQDNSGVAKLLSDVSLNLIDAGSCPTIILILTYLPQLGNSSFWLFLGFIHLNLGTSLIYEFITYEEISYIKLKSQVAWLIHTINDVLFKTNTLPLSRRVANFVKDSKN